MLARLENQGIVTPNERKVPHREGEGHLARFTRSELQRSKSLELFDRGRNGSDLVADVEVNHLASCALACVLDGDGDLERVSGGERRTAQPQIARGEGRVEGLDASDHFLRVEPLIDDAVGREGRLVGQLLAGLPEQGLAVRGELRVVRRRLAILAGRSGRRGLLGCDPVEERLRVLGAELIAALEVARVGRIDGVLALDADDRQVDRRERRQLPRLSRPQAGRRAKYTRLLQ